MTEQQFIEKYSKMLRTGDMFLNGDRSIRMVNRLGCVLVKFERKTGEVTEY